MRSILINAYACSPNMGSEPGMAWNWCANLAVHCELHIITEGEFRKQIEIEVARLPHGKNMHFYYIPVSEDIRRMCWNQGDWRFYKHYKQWQWKTYLFAKELCKQRHIDVLHQLNMIGFREPGYLWKLSKEMKVPFVWGPIGGLKQFPESYLNGAGLKMNIFMRLKNRINIFQLKYDSRVNKAFEQADLLISSIPDSYRAIKKYKGLESIVIPETGCFGVDDSALNGHRFLNDTLTVVWVGKFDFRKRLDIAIKAIAATDNKRIRLCVYGTGSEEQIMLMKQMVVEAGIDDQIQWMGNVSNQEVKQAMQNADIFLFTSISEDTSTVVLEAVSAHLPVICFDTCGMSAVITEDVGKKVPLTNPSQSVQDFAEQLNSLYYNREELQRLSENCKKQKVKLSWEKKALYMKEKYEELLSNVSVQE